eukprot:353202-Chlamydomonas_euryale.AAC.3
MVLVSEGRRGAVGAKVCGWRMVPVFEKTGGAVSTGAAHRMTQTHPKTRKRHTQIGPHPLHGQPHSAHTPGPTTLCTGSRTQHTA